jgi:octaprenyl-diphosphate synthase
VGPDPDGSAETGSLGRSGEDFAALRPYVVGDDLREGKPTLPLLLAMERAGAAERSQIRRAIEQGEQQRLHDIIAVVRRTGALESTRSVAQQEAEKARARALVLPPSGARDALIDLCVRSVHRSS